MAEISDNDFKEVINFIENKTGIFLPDSNYRIVKKFIVSRCSLLNFDVKSYLEYLDKNDDELAIFLDTVTVSETYLFREEKHYNIINNYILPELLKSKSKHLTFWSAACSNGVEAISLIMLLDKHFGVNRKYSLYATDINPIALKFLKNGEYTENAFREDGKSFHNLLDKHIIKKGSKWFLNSLLTDKIKISNINLIDKNMSMLPGNFNLVFFRNALIYMRSDTRMNVLTNIINRMSDTGYLFLSSSEVPLVTHDSLKLIERDGTYFFQKKTQKECDKTKKKEPDIYEFRDDIKLKSNYEENGKIFNLEKVFEYIYKKINDNLFALNDDTNYKYASYCMNIVDIKNSNDHTDFDNLLDKMMSISGYNEIIYYFMGYIEMIENNINKSISLFSKSIESNPSFWPAMFYKSKLLLDISGKDAVQELKTCISHIESYIDDNSFKYDFLLDGFNVKYYFNICLKWLDNFGGAK